MKKSIVLASGGLDSCLTTVLAMDKGYDVSLLHINYGQLTQVREDKAFADIVNYLGIKNTMSVDISYLRNIGGSSLTDSNIKVEEGSLDHGDRLPSTYVPFRNSNMIAIAVSWAEVISASRIFIGAVEEDSSGYPDCTKLYFQKFNELLKVAVSSDIQIETPIIDLSKKDIVELGAKLNAPFHLTWSCYQSENEACGVCESCLLRLRGFKGAGVKDPIKYKFIPDEFKI